MEYFGDTPFGNTGLPGEVRLPVVVVGAGAAVGAAAASVPHCALRKSLQLWPLSVPAVLAAWYLVLHSFMVRAYALPQLTPRMLARFTQIDYASEMALVAVSEEGGEEKMAGVARYAPNPDGESVEYAITIADAWQKRGLGRLMLVRLIECAREKGVKRMEGTVLAINQGMLKLVSELGFSVHADPEAAEAVRVVKALA